MSLLPTAHAGQAFGARRIDFYAVSGEVTGSDAGTGRVRDNEGVDHEVRLLERTSALAPGDNATLLRVQSGPNRRSRPVAIINHSRDVWMRASPDATSLLARSGITRAFNWWLSVLLLALTAFAAVWPQLHVFFSEMFGTAMAGIPAFNVFNEINMLLPSLTGWRLESALPVGLMDSIEALGIVQTSQLTEWGLALAGLFLSLLAFSARSWRLVYMPVLAAFALAAGVILGGAGATLILTGGAVVLFMLGGLINRVRDAGRFNARIERLAEHALRNPPQEGVRTPVAANDDTMTGAAAATAIASAAAMAQGADDAVSEPAEGPAEATALDATPADPDADSANGEVEASPLIELPPAASPEATPSAESPDASDAYEAEADAETIAEAEAETEEETETAAAAEAEPVIEAEAEAGAEAEAETESEMPEAGDAADAEASDDAETEAAVSEASDEDDDLPSLDAVAAAAALSASEQGDDAADTSAPVAAQGSAETDELSDERTMAMAPPPPMPGSETPAPAAEATPEAVTEDESATPPPPVAPVEETAETPEAGPEDAVEPVLSDTPEDTATPDATPTAVDSAATDPLPAPPASDALADVESRVEEAVTAAATGGPAHAMVDDPLMDDEGPDPMMERTQNGDLAPGAPELDMEKDPAE
ncbi:MAG: hypothetical protein NXI03_07240 [Alphaproteobacteria bacterium]|uniref:hypothetical protein n=1 Tax=Maricaulis alexandrii TaxID=2570354 RepID=UPI00110880D0|nr:hypothetical protein [Maricaulis alexandrii]MCR9267352.1 hypothetical protein [Alphaproteobacteria bacterium]